MSFPKYPAYKDSGVEWLGVVPEHWGVSPLKWLAEQVTDKATTSEFQVGLENIEGWAGRFIETDTEFAGDGIAFRQEDILFGKLRPYLAKVWLADRPGQAVGDFFVLRPRAVNSEFLHKYILTPTVIEDLNASTIGAKMPRVGWEDMAALAVTLPPRKEQTQIARFLDHETARIDALIEEQQRLIELLKEKRQAVISHAVTKGLDPTVPMKDSGVEWLGEVPAHWVVRRIKHVTEVISKGTTPTTIGEDFQDEGIRFLKAENIFGGRVLPDPEFFISERAHAALVRSALAENDVLVVIAGATTGKSAVLSGDLLPANTNQAVSFIRLRDTRLSEFIQCWLSTDAVQRSISLNSVQSAQPNLSMEDLGEIPVPLPPLDEIDLITDQMTTQISIFDGLISEAVNASGLLQERRSALISAAVTGKIDVRGWQSPVSTQAPKLEVAEAV